MGVRPIQPQQIIPTFPDEVLQAFNELLQEGGNSNDITIKQDTAMDRILEKFSANGKSISRHDIFDKHWLDVEDTYRNAGWKVKFDKPAYCETYDAYFVFSKK